MKFCFSQSLRHGAPCHLPLHKGGFGLVPLKRVYVTVAWLTGQYTAHLCAAGSIRAMPENEIPPAMRVDFYLAKFKRGELANLNAHIRQKSIKKIVKNASLKKGDKVV